MRRALIVVALVAATTLGGGGAGAAIHAAATEGHAPAPVGAETSDDCEAALVRLREWRGRMEGLRAAYSISVNNDWAYHVSKLGPKMIAGEEHTDELLAAMYDACALVAT